MRKAILNEEISSLTLELSMLLHAGVSVSDALALLAEEDDYKELLSEMAQQADNGASLAECFRENGNFPAYVCGLIEVGERAGRTEEALSALSRYYERMAKLNRRIRSALLYPAVMLVLMLVVIGVLLVKVLPIFDDVYMSLGGQLTGIAGGLLTLGRWLDKAMPVLWVVLALVVVFFTLFAAVAPFRERFLSLLRNISGDKGVFRQMNTARVVQALAMGMSSGLQLEEALELASNLLEDVPAAKARCLSCRESLDQGLPLSTAMHSSGLLPANACRLLEMGHRSGTMDATMEKIAGDLSENSEAAIEEMVSRIEPALVLVCSLLVGLILLSVVLPLMHIMSAIG